VAAATREKKEAASASATMRRGAGNRRAVARLIQAQHTWLPHYRRAHTNCTCTEIRRGMPQCPDSRA
jgi:hypothetical protein